MLINYRKQRGAITDKSEVAQRSREGRKLSCNNNCPPTNASAFKAAIQPIRITRPRSQAKEPAPLALSHTLIPDPLIPCSSVEILLEP